MRTSPHYAARLGKNPARNKKAPGGRAPGAQRTRGAKKGPHSKKYAEAHKSHKK